jgi:hypothetical protein
MYVCLWRVCSHALTLKYGVTSCSVQPGHRSHSAAHPRSTTGGDVAEVPPRTRGAWMRRVEPSAALFMAPRMAMMMGLRGGRGQAVGGLVQPVDDVCVFVFFHGAPQKKKKKKKTKKKKNKKKKKKNNLQPPANIQTFTFGGWRMVVCKKNNNKQGNPQIVYISARHTASGVAHCFGNITTL